MKSAASEVLGAVARGTAEKLSRAMRLSRERARAWRRIVVEEVTPGLYVHADRYDGAWRYTVSTDAKVLAERATAQNAQRACLEYVMRDA